MKISQDLGKDLSVIAPTYMDSPYFQALTMTPDQATARLGSPVLSATKLQPKLHK